MRAMPVGNMPVYREKYGDGYTVHCDGCEEKLFPSERAADITVWHCDAEGCERDWCEQCVTAAAAAAATAAATAAAAPAPAPASPENLDCSVCLDERKNTALLPCRHMCVCADCAAVLVARTEDVKCPICRAMVTETVTVFQ